MRSSSVANRSSRILGLWVVCLLGVGRFVIPLGELSGASGDEGERPNVVWLTSEDNSPGYVRLYSPQGASMPNLERLAESGIVFDNAFSNAPVCSVARSTLITGCYAPKLMAQHHRGLAKAPMPEDLRMFPWYLRNVGYYTSNNSKEDYNLLKGEGVWDDSSKQASYRNRPDGAPFFHVQNFHTTHESSLHFGVDAWLNHPVDAKASSVETFPYLPDTSLVRYTHARYLDLHEKLDTQLGAFLHQLEADELLDNTIVFYFGDHGGVLPGSKGYVFERGVQVPLVVSIPEKWEHLFPTPRGSRLGGFVSFVDFAPTLLNLSGIPIPERMDGKAFLGETIELSELESRDTVLSYADRFDEKIDFVRALRKGNFKYVRRYRPFSVDSLQNNYRYEMLAYQQWRRLYRTGKLDESQAQFFEARTPEALYDLSEDPHELRNLAGDPNYGALLKELRNELKRRLLELPDLSFFPESYLIENGSGNPVAFGERNRDRIESCLRIADLSLRLFEDVEPELARSLQSEDPLERYWALLVCSTFREAARSLSKTIVELAEEEPSRWTRLAAAESLALCLGLDPSDVLRECLEDAEDLAEAIQILNTIALLKELGIDLELELTEAMLKQEWLEDDASLVEGRLKFLRGRGKE